LSAEVDETQSIPVKHPSTSSDSSPARSIRPGLMLIIWLALCFGAAAIGRSFPPGDWYASLAKPAWNPPGWVFGPVWGVLYALMGLAAWLVWRRGGFAAQRRALSLFLVQLALNAAWSPLFFGLQRPDLAFGEILLLWLAIGATLLKFLRVNRTAGWLLALYLAWVTFAAVLNFTLWRMNP
jgi:tryptophan-rich sensory protein